ncbi:FAD/NAD(P)-binding oxidoreductase [Artemisia annua]|uniref:FAD/NAD(P)-binding oxidoreductase n=1 Tax=Artemisia annua TaxID=35608 RepID=A0A2U1L9H7_ARTAN|nr:FAD/NAD(P)-binding oxidoreductase [Artemisia annua]
MSLTGFSADKRSDVRLYYGARNLQRMTYQDRFKVLADSGVTVVPVLSQPEDGWDGESSYVQVQLYCLEEIPRERDLAHFQ